MAIRSGLSDGVQDLAAATSDTVLHSKTFRTSISASTLYNTTSGNAEVTLYESPNDTSASGTELANFTLGPKGRTDDSRDIFEVIGQGFPAGIRLIGVVETAGLSLGDVTAKITYTEFTGDS